MFGYGQGYGRQRGRCRGRRWIEQLPETTYFHPQGIPRPQVNVTLLTLEELEALRLVDLEDLTQEEAAIRMGISRKTLWNDLQRARKKVVNALVKGSAIRIQGGNYMLRTKHPQDLQSIESPPYPPMHPMHQTITEGKAVDKARQILQLLPGTNCGVCGYTSCEECASAIASGDASYDVCRIAGKDVKDKIKQILEER